LRVPLTLSHPAAVLPLRKLGLPVTAMVVGSMTPDVPLFMGWQRGYLFSHSLLGVATVDVVVTLVAVWLWFAVTRDALVDLAPDAVRSRLVPHVTLTPRRWALAVPAAFVGALTHVLWDGFTHPGRWGVNHLPWLQLEHAGLLGYRWAQYVSGVLGLVIVCLAAAGHLRALPPIRRPAPRAAWVTSLLPAVAAVGAASGVATATMNVPSGLHAMAFHGVVNAILAVIVSVTAVCLGWRYLVRQTNPE
jgi:hypothetical protein